MEWTNPVRFGGCGNPVRFGGCGMGVLIADHKVPTIF